MGSIIGVAEQDGREMYVVEVRTVNRAPERVRHWRARVNALAAAGVFGKSVDMVRELPRTRVQRTTEVVREIQTEDNLATEVWEVQVVINV